METKAERYLVSSVPHYGHPHENVMYLTENELHLVRNNLNSKQKLWEIRSIPETSYTHVYTINSAEAPVELKEEV